MSKRTPFALGLAFCGLGIALCLHPISALAGTIRDDVSDSQYTTLAAQPEYAAVGAVKTSVYNGGATAGGSGTLIDSFWVLTAGHLTSNPSPLSATFTIGGVDYTVAEWIPHQSYSPSADNSVISGADIGLMRLNVAVTSVTAATRFTGTSELGSAATIVGYGNTGDGLGGEQNNSYGTKRAGQNVLDVLGSNMNHPNYTITSPNEYVIADFDRPSVPAESSYGSATPLALEYSSAHGDSGGGVFINVGGQTRLAGVVSFGLPGPVSAPDGFGKVADYGDVMGFTRVNQFNGWIDDQLSAIYWNNAASGGFATAANWQGGAAPGAANVAVFNRPGTYSVTLGSTTDNKRVRVRSGDVTLNMGGGTYTLASSPLEPSLWIAGKSTAENANLTVTGTNAHLVIAGGVTVGGEGSGTLNIDGGTIVSIGGKTIVASNGTLNIASGSVSTGGFDLLGGTIMGPGSLTAGGPSTWSKGTMSGSGKTTIPFGASLLIYGTLPSGSDSIHSLLSRTLENAGTVTWQGGDANIDTIWGSGNGSTINNLVGGFFDMQNDSRIYYSTGTGYVFNSAGTLRKSAGTGTSSIGWIFNNTGVVEVQTGTLSLSGGGTDTGSFSVSSGATLAFSGGTHELSGAASLTGSGNLALVGGTLAITGNVARSQMTWSGGTMSGSGTTTIQAGGTLAIDGNYSDKTLSDRTLANAGTVTWSDYYIHGSGTATINNLAGAIFQTGSAFQGTIYMDGVGTFNNAGTFRKLPGANATTISWPFNNSGTVEVQAGTLSLSGSVSQVSGSTLTGGTWKVFANSTLSFGGGNITTNKADVLLSGSGSSFAEINSLTNNQGTFAVSDGRAFTTVGALSNSGTLRVSLGGTLTVTSIYTQTGGVTQLDGGVLASSSPFSLQAGLLAGSGTVNGSISSSGAIAPGSSPGALTVNGSLSLLANSELRMEIGGLFQGTQYDYVDVNGSVSLGGQLVLSFLNGFQSMVSDSNIFTLLTADAPLTGAFSDVANGARLATADGLGSFVVHYGAGSAYGANNLVLTNAIPEPSIFVMLLVGVAVLPLVRRPVRGACAARVSGASVGL
jgi:hypothetical protein